MTTLNELSQELRAWQQAQDLPFQCAAEQLATRDDLSAEQRAWLADFSQRWEVADAQEAAMVRPNTYPYLRFAELQQNWIEEQERHNSAFPRTVTLGNNGPEFHAPGMSLRAYFMAHAPAEPQFWFKLEEELEPFSNEREKRRYIEWPAAWADAQLAILDSKTADHPWKPLESPPITEPHQYEVRDYSTQEAENLRRALTKLANQVKNALDGELLGENGPRDQNGLCGIAFNRRWVIDLLTDALIDAEKEVKTHA